MSDVNMVVLTGRLTKDIDLRYSQGGTAYCSFSLAVGRKFKKEGQPDCDFINCKSFGKTAEFMGKYLSKGRRIAIVGNIQTGSYEKDNQKVYTTDVIVSEVNFADSKKQSEEKDEPFDVDNISTTELPF